MGCMYIQQIQDFDKRRSLVICENQKPFVLYKGEIRKLGLESDMLLTEDKSRSIINDILLPRAKKRVLHLLEQKPMTQTQLSEKLSKGGYPDNVIDEAIAYAKSFHYVDDERYARDFVRFSMEKKSKTRIRQDLSLKGLPRELIDRAIEEEYVTDERSLMRELLQKKGYSPNDATKEQKQKMYRYLASKGYSCNLISEVLRISDY